MSMLHPRRQDVTAVCGVFVKLLKLYAWEFFFMKKILGIRDQELKVLRKGAIVGAVTYIMWFCSSIIVSFYVCVNSF